MTTATFWTIRLSNAYKRIKFRTFLHKLRLESQTDLIRYALQRGIIPPFEK